MRGITEYVVEECEEVEFEMNLSEPGAAPTAAPIQVRADAAVTKVLVLHSYTRTLAILLVSIFLSALVPRIVSAVCILCGQQVMDRIIWYLRIVHSVDLYAAVEYPLEDKMPHRVGIIHVRDASGAAAGKTASGSVTAAKTQFTSKDVEVATKAFHERLAPLLASRQRDQLDEREARRFGLRDTNAEMEVFLNANAQQLSSDKFLCAICSKKFVSADFVKKHIQTRHPERLEQIASECEFFNNYVRDPHRPLPAVETQAATGAGGGAAGLSSQLSPPPGGYSNYRPRPSGPYGSYGYRQQGFRGGSQQSGYRQPGTAYQQRPYVPRGSGPQGGPRPQFSASYTDLDST